MRNLDDVFIGLANSPFRQRFKLDAGDQRYLVEKGLDLVLVHAWEFIDRRLAPARPPHDGRQTPFRGHPVFVAQHATATCCRGCLAKWHGVAPDRPLSAEEQEHVIEAVGRWLRAQAPMATGGAGTAAAGFGPSTRPRISGRRSSDDQQGELQLD
jgi:hypothetical protein